ncbi:MAG: T9SS type A sorting domain-containing protein, partial [Bacteroidales bacterium]|nr:T9SS type A sorting domain-containing protein [Bacteroidales bacterium]
IDNINFEIVTSIDEYGTAATTEPLLIFPNPANDHIEIRTSDDNGIDILDEVIIYNMFGKLIKSYKNTTSRISISDLANGVYIVKSGNAVGKFVKNAK